MSDGATRAKRKARQVANKATAVGAPFSAEEAHDVAALEKLLVDLRELRKDAEPGEAARVASAEVLAFRQIQSLRAQAERRRGPTAGPEPSAELVEEKCVAFLRSRGWKCEQPPPTS